MWYDDNTYHREIQRSLKTRFNKNIIPTVMKVVLVGGTVTTPTTREV